MSQVHSELLKPGWPAHNFSLKGTDGKDHSLDEFVDKPAVLVIFTCNHCPYALASWPQVISLHEKFHDRLGFIAVNPNDPDKYPEDSFERMQAKAKEWDLLFPYVIDTTQETARAYQAQCTPDPYLFKRQNDSWLLYYHGRINDNWQEPEKVTDYNLEAAMTALLQDEPPPDNQPPSMGCSIKWKGNV